MWTYLLSRVQQKNCRLRELEVKMVKPLLNDARKSSSVMPHRARRLAKAVPLASPKKKEARVGRRNSGMRAGGSNGRPFEIACVPA